MIVAVRTSTTATNHLADFVLGAYEFFTRTQLLELVPPSIGDEPAAEEEGAAPLKHRGKRVIKGSDTEALDTAIVVTIEDYIKVSQLFEATRLKLAVARLSEEHIFESKSKTNKQGMSCMDEMHC
ncbi:hypothetical protein JCGZ_00538 [Jatropha curcas]|uniref:Uncharacterized protein n=1 Tax=Jatropha curcas TaxID=180498 RepID=A0A067LFU4_JATCU|nr:hypothetical protein JCGZ_00538 [Jatropha curcas]